MCAYRALGPLSLKLLFCKYLFILILKISNYILVNGTGGLVVVVCRPEEIVCNFPY